MNGKQTETVQPTKSAASPVQAEAPKPAPAPVHNANPPAVAFPVQSEAPKPAPAAVNSTNPPAVETKSAAKTPEPVQPVNEMYAFGANEAGYALPEVEPW